MSAAETIVVFIDPKQLTAQQTNHYSLYLAKKVNHVFTVIWQSLGPIASVGCPSYEYKNTFKIVVPAYQVNYGTVTQTDGSVSFNAAGQPVTMNLGQTVDLTKGGAFANVTNGGQDGTLTINNALAANPNEVLSDNQGNPIFVNTQSGMDIGVSQITPIDEYQLWFGSYVDTGTIIANNTSNVGIVTFNGGASRTISYTSDGTWEAGPLPPTQVVLDAAVTAQSTTMIVSATFTTALTIAAVTYLLSKLISKFDSLKPTSIQTTLGSVSMTVRFDKKQLTSSTISLDAYEQAVNNALNAAAKDSNSGIKKDSWVVSETAMQMNF